MENIIIVTIKKWNIKNYFKFQEVYKNKYSVHLITNKEELTVNTLQKIKPKYIFFPHWSWIIEKEIYSKYTCVLFHMTDLPYGRGGSPFQNLIINGVYDTKISMLKVNGVLDTGDIYLKENFNISLGSAEENFINLSKVIFEKLIPKFLQTEITPEKQTGEVTQFKRRKQKDSNIETLKVKNLNTLYDFIRMLDADGYPKAYLETDKVKIEFCEVHMKNNKLVGRFEVVENEKKNINSSSSP